MYNVYFQFNIHFAFVFSDKLNMKSCIKNFLSLKASLLLIVILLTSTFAFAATRRTLSSERQKVINTALQLIGTKYVWGGTTTAGFDCSGYVGYVYANALGKQLPRKASAIYSKCKIIDSKSKEPGDLMFFTDSSGEITHVGIYCGIYHSTKNKNSRLEGKRVFISSVSSGPSTGVQLELISASYWKTLFKCYGRILPASQ